MSKHQKVNLQYLEVDSEQEDATINPTEAIFEEADKNQIDDINSQTSSRHLELMAGQQVGVNGYADLNETESRFSTIVGGGNQSALKFAAIEQTGNARRDKQILQTDGADSVQSITTMSMDSSIDDY